MVSTSKVSETLQCSSPFMRYVNELPSFLKPLVSRQQSSLIRIFNSRIAYENKTDQITSHRWIMLIPIKIMSHLTKAIFKKTFFKNTYNITWDWQINKEFISHFLYCDALTPCLMSVSKQICLAFSQILLLCYYYYYYYYIILFTCGKILNRNLT